MVSISPKSLHLKVAFEMLGHATDAIVRTPRDTLFSFSLFYRKKK